MGAGTPKARKRVPAHVLVAPHHLGAFDRAAWQSGRRTSTDRHVNAASACRAVSKFNLSSTVVCTEHSAKACRVRVSITAGNSRRRIGAPPKCGAQPHADLRLCEAPGNAEGARNIHKVFAPHTRRSSAGKDGVHHATEHVRGGAAMSSPSKKVFVFHDCLIGLPKTSDLGGGCLRLALSFRFRCSADIVLRRSGGSGKRVWVAYAEKKAKMT